MIIKRIKAENFKTYLKLDLNLEPEKDRPIILIGGQNGGGKSTLFESIYGALYGLNISKVVDFETLFNNGNKDFLDKHITLEIHFNGKVLEEIQHYVLTRTYKIGQSSEVIESVKLNMNGNIFNYSSTEPLKTRQKAESDVNKIIRANLPKELSKYFLFDAMESGALLKDDQLAKVIKENIDNVMGFNKYNLLAKCSADVYQTMTAQRFKAEKDKTSYLKLVESQKNILKEVESKELILSNLENFLSSQKEMYNELKSGLNQEESLKARIEQLKSDNDSFKKRQGIYKANLDTFIKDLELNIGLPMLALSFHKMINSVLNKIKEAELNSDSIMSRDLTQKIVEDTIYYLRNYELLNYDIDVNKIIEFIYTQNSYTSDMNSNSVFDNNEVLAMQKLINTQYSNQFPHLYATQLDLNSSLNSIKNNRSVIDELTKHISFQDFSMIQTYEKHQNDLNETKQAIKLLKEELKKVDKELSQFDISDETEPDPKYELVKKLSPFFNESVQRLLSAKKKMIEQALVTDLNINLIPYKGVIEKVEFGSDMKDFTFKMYHNTGNEISLNQLNTASKQMVVQCLLKALHRFGDYNPPVMIDTVMGVLDEQSRETVLENYFPKLSHQTILLSSDSEIRVYKDLEKLKAFVCKAYTVKRNTQLQKSDVIDGYFGEEII